MEAIDLWSGLSTHFGAHRSVFENGATIGDEFLLELFQHPHRVLKFTRKSYHFNSGNMAAIDLVNHTFTLPHLGSDKYSFELKLVNIENNKNKLEIFRYILKSNSSFAFKINGIWAKEAFLERGDIIELGLNKIFINRAIKENFNHNLIPDQVIKSSLPIILEGETGTGKTYLAKKIHEESGVHGKFVHLNIASFSTSLIESELFGHIRGAFTGAINDKKGALLEAHRGTLFLDEIDSLSKELQTKLLIYLDSFEFRSVGSERVQESRTRFIFASGTKCEALVNQNLMRKDFFYRLKSGYSLSLPSIREQSEIILNFIENFEQSECLSISHELKIFYCSQQWPGNMRQLKSHLIKKKVLSDGKKIVYDETDRKLLFETEPEIIKSREALTLEQIKNKYCRDVFSQSNCDYHIAAHKLKISVSTLRNLLKEFKNQDEIEKST